VEVQVLSRAPLTPPNHSPSIGFDSLPYELTRRASMPDQSPDCRSDPFLVIDDRQPEHTDTAPLRGLVCVVAPLRRLFAFLIGVAFLLGIPGVTSYGSCTRQVVALCAASGECAPSNDQPADSEEPHDDGDSGICCKCPCNGLNIPVSSESDTLPADSAAACQQRPSDDVERESPVFEIFQPPKLPA
jgi:hypothetical protein